MRTSSTAWWRDSAHNLGPRMMDQGIHTRDWDRAIQSGAREVQQCIDRTGMPTGASLSVLEIGCGIGRLTFALAKHYGYVLGMDVSEHFLERACDHKRRFDYENVEFELADGQQIRPAVDRAWDVIFSCEVFHHIEPETLARYCHDAYRLLRPGGTFVFQLNVKPITAGTLLLRPLRYAMFLCGKSEWRGFPNAPGFQRKCHPISLLRSYLSDAGFRIERVLDDVACQSWFVAVKPEASA